MTKTSRTVVFFGTEDFSLAALQGLIEANYPVAVVVTKPDAPRGRGHKLTPPAVKTLAQSHHIPVIQPKKLDDAFLRQLTEIVQTKEAAGVLSSYGKIVPQAVLDFFTPGIINIHPSLLPLYRGPSPIEAAILNGDSTTGVSIMRLVREMDAGPVYVQEEIKLAGSETKPELYRALADLGGAMLIKHLPAILSGELQPIIQDEARATYCPLLNKSDGILDPKQLTAEQAERRVRAYLGYPKTKLEVGGKSIIVTKAHVSSNQKTPLDLSYQDGAYLVIDELIAPSGRTMTAEDYLRGQR